MVLSVLFLLLNRGGMACGRHALLWFHLVLLVSTSSTNSRPTAVVVAAASTSSGDAPWQTAVSTAEDDDYKDLGVTLFAPSGRLVPVENAVARIHEDESSNTVLALVCRDGVVVVATLPSSPYLVVSSHPESVVPATKESETKGGTDDGAIESLLLLEREDRVGIPPTAMAPFLLARASSSSAALSTNVVLAVTAGNPVYSQLMRRRVLSLVQNVRASEGDWSVGGLARQCADQLQVRTQKADEGDVLPVAVLLVDARQIWRVDPTGQFWKFQAVASGRHAARVEQLLRDKVAASVGTSGDDDDDKKLSSSLPLRSLIANLSTQEALRIATECVVEAYETQVPSALGAGTRSRTVTMRGVVIAKDEKVRCYSGTDLMARAVP